MRVAICSNVLWEARPCGTKTFLIEVFTRICRTAPTTFSLTIVAPPGEPSRLAAEALQGLAVVRPISMKKWSARVLWLMGAFNLVDRIGHHDVYLSGWHWPLGGRDTPFVAIVHDLGPPPGARTASLKAGLARILYRLSFQAMVRRASCVIGDSEVMLTAAERLVRRSLPSRTVIHLGVDAQRWSNRASEAELADAAKYCGLPRGARFILALGSHVLNKNHARLVAAFADGLAARDPAVHLVLAGAHGHETDRIRGIAHGRGLGARVHLPGVIAQEALVPLMQGATVFAFPSMSEGFGIPVLEAFAAQVPVLCSNRGSLPEVAGDAAVLVDPESVEALAEGLTRLAFDDDLRAILISKGRARAAEFSWDKVADRYLDVVCCAAGVDPGDMRAGR